MTYLNEVFFSVVKAISSLINRDVDLAVWQIQ